MINFFGDLLVFILLMATIYFGVLAIIEIVHNIRTKKKLDKLQDEFAATLLKANHHLYLGNILTAHRLQEICKDILEEMEQIR